MSDNHGEVPLGPKPPKSYKDVDFLTSPEARMIRIRCEFEQPKQQLEKEGVENIVMFLSSAQLKSGEEYEKALADTQGKVDGEEKKRDLNRLQKTAFMVPYYEATRELATKFTKWNMERQQTRSGKPTYVVGTGGRHGPANEGAQKAGGKSCGFGISLPSEGGLNPYCSPELSFEFHYFFTRKFWMAYKVMGLVVAPGGLGTCDEMFEILTLKQVGKIKRPLPIILIGKKFWHDCINWQSFVDYGMISQSDYDQIHFVDTAEDAFKILKHGIENLESLENGDHGAPSPKKAKTS
jgi:uncharacterized protein (TIGR00730 family)